MALEDGEQCGGAGCCEVTSDNSSEEELEEVRKLYTDKEFTQAIQAAEGLLPHCSSPRLLSETHLLLAKCHRGQGDLKSAILSCNSSIHHHSTWKEPFLYRSACFQALHTAYQETCGDCSETIAKDREEADIIVDPNAEESSGLSEEGKAEEEERRAKLRLFRQDVSEPKSPRIVVNKIDEALRRAKEGQTIFVEPGVYQVSAGASKELSSFFLFGKNLRLVGASVKDCVLLYKRTEGEEAEGGRLETFLVCAGPGAQPTLVKRLTFRNGNPSTVKTKFFGVAGGRVQFEDCLFDGVESPEVDAVYTNAKICGALASNYPSPTVCLRFCVFDHCQSFGGVTVLHALATLRCCYFTGVGRKAVAALDSAKVTVENCEFSQSEETETCISGTESDITVVGCYIQGSQLGVVTGGPSQAIGVTLKSVARIEKNYIYQTGCGISSSTSDITCARNLVYSCSRRYSLPPPISSSTSPSPPNFSNVSSSSTLGLHSGIALRGRSKASLVGNQIKHCDVGLHLTDSCVPAVKDNTLDSCFFSGIFAENGARPNLVANILCGGDAGGQVPRGLGLLLILGAGGLVARNIFKDYQVSPLMVFSQCHPVLKGNIYNKVCLDEEKQASLEKSLLNQFSSECQQDSYFYMVESAGKEEALADVIRVGPEEINKT